MRGLEFDELSSRAGQSERASREIALRERAQQLVSFSFFALSSKKSRGERAEGSPRAISSFWRERDKAFSLSYLSLCFIQPALPRRLVLSPFLFSRSSFLFLLSTHSPRKNIKKLSLATKTQRSLKRRKKAKMASPAPAPAVDLTASILPAGGVDANALDAAFTLVRELFCFKREGREKAERKRRTKKNSTKTLKTSKKNVSAIGLPRLLHALRLRDALGGLRPRPLLQAHLHSDSAGRVRVGDRVLPGELLISEVFVVFSFRGSGFFFAFFLFSLLSIVSLSSLSFLPPRSPQLGSE